VRVAQVEQNHRLDAGVVERLGRSHRMPRRDRCGRGQHCSNCLPLRRKLEQNRCWLREQKIFPILRTKKLPSAVRFRPGRSKAEHVGQRRVQGARQEHRQRRPLKQTRHDQVQLLRRQILNANSQAATKFKIRALIEINNNNKKKLTPNLKHTRIFYF